MNRRWEETERQIEEEDGKTNGGERARYPDDKKRQRESKNTIEGQINGKD